MKKVIVVGYGDRGSIYSKYALNHADEMKIVAVVDPNKYRRGEASRAFGISAENCFESVEQCISRGKFADAVINATMDSLHIKTSIPFLKLGYDMLLEKPITNNRAELELLADTAKENGCKLMICHVLRYTPFYSSIKKVVLSGEIGEIVNITSSECVGLCHASHSYIRGKWSSRAECGSSMLLAKCSHDIDLICWLNNKSSPVKATSIGGRYFFVEKNAPKQAGTRCLVDCPIEKDCIYSARKITLNHNYFSWLAWDCFDKPIESITTQEKIQSLKTDNAHGRCIFKTKADLIDRQIVSVQFSDGSVASHTLIAGVARAGRTLHIVGTLGEVDGFLEDGKFVVRTYNPETLLHEERIVDVSGDVNSGDGHSGGDSRLVADFISILSGKAPSVSATSIDDSIFGHLTVFAADESLDDGGNLKQI